MATTAATEVVTRNGLLPNFALGLKKVYLPNHTIAFVRPVRNQPPNFATFLVPLKFNKLDFRDYLWNVYGVQIRGVRSFVLGAPIETDRKTNHSKRGTAKKMMTVELKEPFVWPDKPEDLKPWSKEVHEAMENFQKFNMERQKKTAFGFPPLRDEIQKKGRQPRNEQLTRQMAKDMLSGKMRWQSSAELDEKWTEVEMGTVVKQPNVR